jgi:putative tryptophan/tyrosine transport system substrate-binding protein
MCYAFGRSFITMVGGAAAAWPLAVRAQQGERVRRIGVLTALAANDPEGQARVAAFLQGLEESGWSVGRNVRIDIRWSAGNADDTRKYAAELVALAPDIILATTTPAAAVLTEKNHPSGSTTTSKRSFETSIPQKESMAIFVSHPC